MSIRVNTLGKGAIVNRQLNSAYDIVEYVADNLPMLLEAANRIKLIANIDYVKDHVDRTDIHLSHEDREKIDRLLAMSPVEASEFAIQIASIAQQLHALTTPITDYINHARNGDIHVSEHDRELLNSLSDASEDIEELKGKVNELNQLVDSIDEDVSTILDENLGTVAYSNSYNDLDNKPVIDTALSNSSTNAVENKAVTRALSDKVSSNAISSVAYSGSYNDLINKPIIEDRVVQGSNNAISSNAVYELLHDLTEGSVSSLYFNDGMVYITHADGTVTSQPYVYTDRISEEEIDTLFEE